MKFSICVLLYGDHLSLAERCLSSISGTPGFADNVADVRLGLHNLSARSRNYTMCWSRELAAQGKRVIHYAPWGNVYKYPTMRRMVHDRENPVADYVMWFDDDSYLTQEPDFWDRVKAVMVNSDMIGQPWLLAMQGDQKKWITAQPWFNPELGLPKSGKFSFCQGGWWTIRATCLRELNWPVPELCHCGGDSMLGEAVRQKGYSVNKFDYGVRINADESGSHSSASRRGHTERVVGSRFSGEPLSREHQNFKTEVFTFEGDKVDQRLI